MQINIQLPPFFQSDDLFQWTHQIFAYMQGPKKTFVFDFSQLRFVLPSGIVFLNNLLNFIMRSGHFYQLTGIQTKTEPLKFLDDSGFFLHRLGHKMELSSAPRSTTQPLVEIMLTDSHAWVRQTFIPWLSAKSNIPVADLYALGTCFSEIFNNIGDHSTLNIGSTFSQWFPQKDRLVISIADFGKGIPAAIRERYSDYVHQSDAAAISFAMQEGVSSKSTPTNRGSGLTYLHDNVVGQLNGTLTIKSARGSVSFYKTHGVLSSRINNIDGICPGTQIDITLSTNLVERTGSATGDFEWF